MPPKKRTAAESNSGAAGGRRSKRQSTANNDKEDAEQPSAQPDAEEQQEQSQDEENTGEAIDKGDPFEYLCFPRPFFDFEAENDSKDEDEMLDEDEVVDRYNDMIKSLPVRGHTRFSEKAPDHRFFAMREAIRLRTDLRVRADYSNPDAFNMYVFNDFHGYGIGEVVENVLVTFDNEFKKKRDDKSLKAMWANIAGLNHWFVEGGIMPWIGSDDGERVKTTVETVGKAILTAFNELDLAGHLKADSEIKDIGLVVSLIMHWANDMPQYGIDEVEWCKDVVAYAKKAGVDLVATGSYSAEKDLESLEEEHGEIAALKGAAKADRWGWKKSFKKFKDSYGPIGGDKYNIMKWSRKERAAKAFDKKDPLAKFSDAEIASGNLMLG